MINTKILRTQKSIQKKGSSKEDISIMKNLQPQIYLIYLFKILTAKSIKVIYKSFL